VKTPDTLTVNTIDLLRALSGRAADVAAALPSLELDPRDLLDLASAV
jgi:hypothetical protein